MIEEILRSLTEWGKKKKRGDDVFEPYYSKSHEFGHELKERISYHADFDVFPSKLINSAAPNEDAKEFSYRKANYKQVTKPVWDKAMSATYRIFNPQNFSIEWDDEVEDFFTYNYPKTGNFLEFFKDVIHKMKFADPNAVAVVKPYFIPTKEQPTDEGMEVVVDQSIPITPVTELYSADCVFEFRHEWCLLLTQDKSTISVLGKPKKEGLIFEFYDRNTIYKIIQYGDQKDWTFVAEEHYTHNWGYMPCWKLRGVPLYDPIDILYYSHFMCAVPNLDQAAFLSSTSFGVINKVAFPTRWYYEDNCGTCQGQGWNVEYNDDVANKVRCGDCGGSGHKMTFTFGKDYIIPMPENNIQQDTTTLPTPPFGVVDPPVESIKFLDEKVKYLLETAFMNLNISIVEQPTGTTATEVIDNKDELISFLMQVSGEEFWLMQEMIDAHTFMMSLGEQVVKVKKPTEFRIRNSADLTEELKQGFESHLPAPYLLKLVQENIDQRFQNDDIMNEVIKTVALVDPLMTSDANTINSLASDGSIEKWQKTLHYCIYNFIYIKLEENPNYLQGDIKTITADLNAMAKALVVKSNSATSILDTI